jgi:hypothetical protein
MYGLMISRSTMDLGRTGGMLKRRFSALGCLAMHRVESKIAPLDRRAEHEGENSGISVQ